MLLLFPVFHLIGGAANPGLAEAARRAPVVVSGPDCGYDPFAKVQATECSRLLDYFSKKGVHYEKAVSATTHVSVAGVVQADTRPEALDATLADAGYDLGKVKPSFVDSLKILLGILTLGALSGATYGPVAALLSELFPARIRYKIGRAHV